MDITPYYKEASQYVTTIHPYIYNSVGIYGIWIVFIMELQIYTLIVVIIGV